MTFDKPEHKIFFLELLARSAIPGHLLDVAHELKNAAMAANQGNAPEQRRDQP